MSSKKEEEKNERIIRGLMKLPPNRRCINCDSLGPQYVCTNFWTFICISCSGIHREFTHRVKSVSMAKFTAQEVDALQRGGNQRARETFLKYWDVQRTRLPNSSNVDKIREFIRSVYVDKKYAEGRSSDKPPRDMQSLQSHEDHRRASSYHSFSQSPPYDHQYEDRRYGKQAGMLTRKPGSDRGHSEGKISTFLFSPGRQGEQIYGDTFANEGSDSRISDYSVSSRNDPFISDAQSPSFPGTGYNSPPSQQLRDILIEDAQPHILKTFPEGNVKRGLDGIPSSQRAASSSSFGSSDGNSATNLGSLLDIVLEPVQQPSTSIAPSVDLFADINHQASCTAPTEQKSFSDSFLDDVGWATFDLPHHSGSASQTNNGLTPMVPSGLAAQTNASSTMYNNLQWFSVPMCATQTLFPVVEAHTSATSTMHSNSQWLPAPAQSSSTQGHFPLMNNNLHSDFHEAKVLDYPKNSQSWNAFDDFHGNVSRTSVDALPKNRETKVVVSNDNGFQKSAVDDDTLGFNLPFIGIDGSSFPASVLPTTEGTAREQKSTNPFDLPYDSDLDANDVFSDMSSLQEALPNSQSEPWFPQDPSTTFIPSEPHGGELSYIAGQVPSSQLQNAPPQSVVASHGNPFA